MVCEAVELIINGALDDGGTEAALADRIGMSPRHLRRLFLKHLGASPDQLARSRRAHFARRLLDDTDLTIADVAFASGFGSLRQFNRTMQEVFAASPTGLRDRRRRAERSPPTGGWHCGCRWCPAMTGTRSGHSSPHEPSPASKPSQVTPTGAPSPWQAYRPHGSLSRRPGLPAAARPLAVLGGADPRGRPGGAAAGHRLRSLCGRRRATHGSGARPAGGQLSRSGRTGPMEPV